MPKISILAYNNCVASSILGGMDTFAMANLLHSVKDCTGEFPLLTPEIITHDGKPIYASGGFPFYPTRAMTEISDTDLIIIPGGFIPLYLNSDEMRRIYSWVTSSYEKGVRIAAICTGTFALAETGLLDDKVATTNWHFARIFSKSYPRVKLKIDQMLTEDSNLICTGNVTAYFNLSLRIIEQFGGKELSAICSKTILVDQHRKLQSPYFIYDFLKNHNDDQILKAQTWLEENYSQKFSMDSLAKKVGLSPRHFKRRFKRATDETPLAYLQQIRIEIAKKELENTINTVNEITYKVGYEDIHSFRRLFKRHTGMSPKAYRSKFSVTNTIG